MVEAESGETAIELARNYRPTHHHSRHHDAPDGRLVGVDRTQIRSRPRRHSRDRGDYHYGSRRGALALGAPDFMTKPIERNRLIAVLNSLLHGRGTVLLVEDEPHSRELTRRQLQRLDVEVSKRQTAAKP